MLHLLAGSTLCRHSSEPQEEPPRGAPSHPLRRPPVNPAGSIISGFGVVCSLGNRKALLVSPNTFVLFAAYFVPVSSICLGLPCHSFSPDVCTVINAVVCLQAEYQKICSATIRVSRTTIINAPTCTGYLYINAHVNGKDLTSVPPALQAV